MLFKIYAGLAGGFGGANYIETSEFESASCAEEYAYSRACEDYEDYEGNHGIRTIYDIMNEDGVDEDEAIDIGNEERDGGLDYYVEEVTEDVQV